MRLQLCPQCGQPTTTAPGVGFAVRCSACQQSFVRQGADRLALLTRTGSNQPQPVSEIRLAPEFLSRFELVRMLGSGAMGMVVSAVDRAISRTVAIKFLTRLDSRELLERFLREARVLGQISHPNVIKIYDLGDLDGHPYLVTEYASGGTLRTRLEGPRPTVGQAVEIALQCLAGLQACHDTGHVHRDLKPENILFDEQGTAKLTDFGISKSLEEEGCLTRTGAMVGTPRYISPEQIQYGQVTRATDVYAMGLVLHEMLVGTPPFMASTLPELLAQHLKVAPAPVHEIVPGVPAQLGELLQRALAKDPAKRPPTASDFAEQIQLAVKPPAPPRPDEARPARRSTRPRVPTVAPPESTGHRRSVRVRWLERALWTGLGVVLGALAVGLASGRGGHLAVPSPTPGPVSTSAPSPLSRPVDLSLLPDARVLLARVEVELRKLKPVSRPPGLDANAFVPFLQYVRMTRRILRDRLEESRLAGGDDRSAAEAAIAQSRVSWFDWQLARAERRLSVVCAGTGRIHDIWSESQFSLDEMHRLHACAMLIAVACVRGAPRGASDRWNGIELVDDYYGLADTAYEAYAAATEVALFGRRSPTRNSGPNAFSAAMLEIERIPVDLGARLAAIPPEFGPVLSEMMRAIWGHRWKNRKTLPAVLRSLKNLRPWLTAASEERLGPVVASIVNSLESESAEVRALVLGLLSPPTR